MSTETAKLQTSSDEPIPCPVDHQCEGEQSCDCWCELHDVPITECPTFQLVDSWTSRLQAELDDVKTDKARLLEAFDMNPLRNWNDIVNAARCIRAERDALKAELAEARASGSHLAEVAADEYLALKAERDAAQAAIERVRAILDQPLLRTSDPERAGERFLARQIAAALDAQGAGRA